ncbi:hypothetical protein L0657_13300 [Dyadobacter sp. CY345]|uniref:hypothetical protein n=1 Tax=Dyadobacter sp. CY345 TaxID=2909335 RepID=UPI001F1BF3A1|nr:hypothetical protein [Dyadobacter sp. CY345]MCF2444938.1 hypothetical protein [Dyadobacter sp. CY345]
MPRIYTFIVLIFAASLNFSCANLKSSLSKSDSSDSRDYSSRTTYASYPRDSAAVSKPSSSYDTRRDDEKNLNTEIKTERKATGTPVTEQNSLEQYSEMDKVADRILYELEINEKQKASLLERFRSASSNDRENISQELNKLDANQLTLYKAYVHVYKDGKSNWPAVRKSVEDTLLGLRGIGNK